MIISNISVPLLGLVDTAILGHLDNAYHLGAVAVGASVLSFVYWGFGFLRMGTTGMTAQAVGKNDTALSSLILLRSGILGIALALSVIMINQPLINVAMQLIAPSENVTPLAKQYCSIRIFSAPAVLVTYAVVGWFIGKQNTRIPLVIVVTTNLLNIALDFLFILGLDMKSEGAALATLIAEYTGCLIAFWFVRREAFAANVMRTKELYSLVAYRDLLKLNFNLFVRTICLLFSFAFFTAQGAQQSDTILAANSILMHLLLLTAFGLDGFAHAVEALAGKAIGEGKLGAFYDAVSATGWWSLLTASLFAAFFWLTQHFIASLFTDLPEVIETVNAYIAWLFVLPFITVGSYWLDGVFIGATQSRAMRNTMLLSCLGFYLPAFYFTQSWGNQGLWFAFSLFSASRTLSLGLLFIVFSRRGRWLSYLS